MAWQDAFSDWKFYVIVVTVIIILVIIIALSYKPLKCGKYGCYERGNWTPSEAFLVWGWIIFLALYAVGTYWTLSAIDEDDETLQRNTFIAFGVGMFAILLWGIFFFWLENFWLSTVMLLIAAGVVVWQAATIYQVNTNGGGADYALFLIIPYLLWLLYLALVTTNICYNRKHPGYGKACTEAERLHIKTLKEQYNIECDRTCESCPTPKCHPPQCPPKQEKCDPCDPYQPQSTYSTQGLNSGGNSGPQCVQQPQCPPACPPQQCQPACPPQQCPPQCPPQQCQPACPPKECQPACPPQQCQPACPPKECQPACPPKECQPTCPPKECQPACPPQQCQPACPPEEIKLNCCDPITLPLKECCPPPNPKYRVECQEVVEYVKAKQYVQQYVPVEVEIPIRHTIQRLVPCDEGVVAPKSCWLEKPPDPVYETTKQVTIVGQPTVTNQQYQQQYVYPNQVIQPTVTSAAPQGTSVISPQIISSSQGSSVSSQGSSVSSQGSSQGFIAKGPDTVDNFYAGQPAEISNISSQETSNAIQTSSPVSTASSPALILKQASIGRKVMV